MTVGRCHAVSKPPIVMTRTTNSLTLEKGRRPDIVMESKIGSQKLQVVVVELVFGPINDCAGKQVSLEAKEKLMRRMGGMEFDYMGWGMMKIIFHFSDSYDCCSTGLMVKPQVMFRLDAWHSNRNQHSKPSSHSKWQ